MGIPPAVTVLLPVRNAAATLDSCLDSIQSQTLSNFELLALDDASSDDTVARLSARACNDPRIRLVRPRRRGLVACLNAGLAEARAPLIARMDGDDIMVRERLALQHAYLESRPEVDVLATRVRAFPDSELRAGMREYLRWQNGCLQPKSIRDDIYVESPLTHPSVMYRRDSIVSAGGYRDGEFPEDYELWLRLNRRGARMAKLDRSLLEWRQHAGSLSRCDSRYAREAFDKLRADYLARDRRLDDTRPVVFWGAGRRTRRRAGHLMAHGVAPSAWIDVDPRKVGNRVHGVPVFSPDWLAARRPDPELRVQCPPFVLIWVASHGARERIAGMLDTMGYTRGGDYLAVG